MIEWPVTLDEWAAIVRLTLLEAVIGIKLVGWEVDGAA